MTRIHKATIISETSYGRVDIKMTKRKKDVQYFEIRNSIGEAQGIANFVRGAGPSHPARFTDGSPECSTCNAIRALALDSSLGSVTCMDTLYTVVLQ
jgi:hypothetical protein